LDGSYRTEDSLKSTLMDLHLQQARRQVFCSSQLARGFIMTGSGFVEHAPILVAEATAMRDGISAALQVEFRKIQVEGDNQIVIKAMQKQIHTRWQIAPILEDIWNMISSCETISFTHTYREGNIVADWMAKYGCSLRCHSLSLSISPPCRDFLFLLVDDNLGETLERRAT